MSIPWVWEVVRRHEAGVATRFCKCSSDVQKRARKGSWRREDRQLLDMCTLTNVWDEIFNELEAIKRHDVCTLYCWRESVKKFFDNF